ncbi:hypothetical protein [Shimia ponticola]|uniref:hypothetical protein n=1 Tax=Shimia ponticola TaxID=2582893 RepID=UPI0011BEACC2|nr:hypothetical protein [Shimia ponticola]
MTALTERRDAAVVEIETGAPLPDYPVELVAGDFTGHKFVMMHHVLYFQSRLHTRADLDVRGAALELFMVCQQRTPLGTLPVDEEEIAQLIRVPLPTWRSLMNRKITPLHKWSRYQVDGEPVFGHKVVIDVCRAALTASEARKARSSGESERNKLKTLKRLLSEAGVPHELVDDPDFVIRCHDWLTKNFTGRRQGARFDAVLQQLFRVAGIEHRIIRD